MKAGSKILGLALGQKSFLVAEVGGKGDRNAVSHCAEFVFPEGLSLSTPDKLGEAFRQFLRSHQINTRDVVIGLPAKRLVTRRKEVPPASPAIAASTLRLQAEGEFTAELDNLVMDFAGTPSPSEATTVLLIATNRVLVDECEAMAKAAGLRVYAVTSTTAALGRATSRLPGGDGLVLSLAAGGAELVVQHGTDPAHMRHLNMGGGNEAVNALAGEIRRMMAAIPRNGTPQTMALWNSGIGENPQSILEQRLSMPVTTPEVSNLVVTETPNTEGYAPAVSLALAALEPAGLPVDFLHSRLAPPKPPAVSQARKLATAAAFIVVAIGAFIYFDLDRKQGEVDRARKANGERAAQVALADAQIKHTKFAESWLPTNPIQIQVLRDVTEVILDRQVAPGSNTLWVTSLSNNHDPLSWEVEGKSVNQEYPGRVVDRMVQWTDRYTNPRLELVQFEQQNNLYNFRITFTYVPPPEATSRPAAAVAATQNTRGRGATPNATGNPGGRNGGGNAANNPTGRNGGGNAGGNATAGGNAGNTPNAGRNGGGNAGGGRNGGGNPNNPGGNATAGGNVNAAGRRGGRGGGGPGGAGGGFGGAGGGGDPGAVDGGVDPVGIDPAAGDGG